jgi:hypothetical protein
VEVSGTLTLVESSRPGFPWARLVDQTGTEILEVGRYSALNIFLGRGQRIRLADDRTWRLKSRMWHKYVCPVLVDDAGRRLATSAPGIDDYAITCQDRGFMLIPAEERAGRPRRWELLSFGDAVAHIRRNPYRAEVLDPIPLPALLMAWGLATVGIMGEKELIPQMGWSGPIAH